MDLEKKVDREVFRHAVAKKIICEKSGKVLDVRTAVGAEVNYTSGNTSWVVVDQEFWPDVAGRIPGIEAHPLVDHVKVYDGRELFGRKKVAK